LENTNSVLNAQKTPCLTTSQCTTDFSIALDKALENNETSHSLFPVAGEMVNNFIQLPHPLLFINALYWQAATAIVEQHNDSRLPLLALQHYDQEALFGRINQNSDGTVTLIPGEIVNLNSGLLVLHISPLLVNPELWFALKAFLLSQKISINAAVNGHKLRSSVPQATPQQINTKVVLVANRYQLDELSQIDPDFSQIRSLFAEIAGNVKSSDENIQAIYRFTQQLIREHNLTALTQAAYNALFTHLSRLCEHQKNLQFSPQLIESTLRYAQLMHSRDAGASEQVDASHILQALNLQKSA